jgi:transcription initiation factor TFIIB
MPLNPSQVRALKLLQQQRCPECGNTQFITDGLTGEMSCHHCGLVISDTALDKTPEWRAFTQTEKKMKARTGTATRLHYFDQGISSTFKIQKDYNGKLLTSSAMRRLLRLKRWQYRARIHTPQDRSLYFALSEMMRLADGLNIPAHVVETAAFIYRKAAKLQLIRGRSINGFAAATLYMACRLSQLPRYLSTITANSSRSHKEIARNYRILTRHLKFDLPLDDPCQYVTKIAADLNLNQRIQNQAMALIRAAHQHHAIVGKKPRGIAAAAVYTASKLHGIRVTQADCAKAADVTEVTVRYQYKNLDHILQLGLRNA